MEEEWRKIDGFPFYEVSNTGGVRSLHRSRATLSPCVNRYGYEFVLLWKDKRQHMKTIHRLVAAAFIGDVEGMDVHHKDGNRQNNDAENLEILTHEEHMARQDFRPYTPKEKRLTLRKIEGRTTAIPIFNGRGGVIKYGLVRSEIEKEISRRGFSLTAFLKGTGIKNAKYYNDPADLETIAIISNALSLPPKQIICRLQYMETTGRHDIGKRKPKRTNGEKQKPFSRSDFKAKMREVFGRDI